MPCIMWYVNIFDRHLPIAQPFADNRLRPAPANEAGPVLLTYLPLQGRHLYLHSSAEVEAQCRMLLAAPPGAFGFDIGEPYLQVSRMARRSASLVHFERQKRVLPLAGLHQPAARTDPADVLQAILDLSACSDSDEAGRGLCKVKGDMPRGEGTPHKASMRCC